MCNRVCSRTRVRRSTEVRFVVRRLHPKIIFRALWLSASRHLFSCLWGFNTFTRKRMAEHPIFDIARAGKASELSALLSSLPDDSARQALVRTRDRNAWTPLVSKRKREWEERTKERANEAREKIRATSPTDQSLLFSLLSFSSLCSALLFSLCLPRSCFVSIM